MKQHVIYGIVLTAVWLLTGINAHAQDSLAMSCGTKDIQVQYDSEHKRYHIYRVVHDVGLIDEIGMSPKELFQLMLSDKQLLAPCKSEDAGPVVDCDTVYVKIGPMSRNPVLVSVDTAQMMVTNYSLPGHFLHPGKVIRSIVEEDGRLMILTTSEGEGRMPTIDEQLAESVWRRVDRQLILRAKEE